jgi:hypothetical protein
MPLSVDGAIALHQAEAAVKIDTAALTSAEHSLASAEGKCQSSSSHPAQPLPIWRP